MDISAFIRCPLLDGCPEQDFILGDWLKVGSLVLMTAESNVGKTAFALALAEAVSTGSNFLSCEVNKRTKALFVQFDMDDNTFVNYNKLFAPNCPMQVLSEDHYTRNKDGTIRRHEIDFTSADNIDAIINHCKSNDIGLIVIDTLSAVFRNIDENSNSQMTEAMMKLKHISFAGITVVVLHHVAKVINGTIHVVRGASSILACVDTHVALYYTKEKVGESKVVASNLNKSRSTARRVLGMFYIDGIGFHEYVSNAKLSTNLDDKPVVEYVAVKPEKLVELRKGILKIFKDLNVDTIDMGIIGACTVGHYTKKVAALDSLIADGVIKPSKRGKANIWTLVKEVE